MDNLLSIMKQLRKSVQTRTASPSKNRQAFYAALLLFVAAYLIFTTITKIAAPNTRPVMLRPSHIGL